MTAARSARTVAGCLLLALAAVGCSSTGAGNGQSSSSGTPQNSPSPAAVSSSATVAAPVPAPFRHPLPGMPAARSGDVYAAAGANQVSPSVAGDPAYLYVPNDALAQPSTTVIDQRTHKIVRVLPTGQLSQHVTPSYDLRTLYVEASLADQLVAIDPHTGRVKGHVHQQRPYNLYFTPDGKEAIDVAEEQNQLIFEDAHSFRRRAVVSDPSCQGPNHADFSANGRYFLISCEFSGSLLEVSTLEHKVIGSLRLPAGSKPQDVRLSPDGRVFYVADMGRDKLLRIDWRRLRVVGHTDTPSMPHGIYPSRDGKLLYVSDRGAGEVSVVSVATNRIVATWKIPGGGSPDMGGVSADGKTLWLSGRFDGEVYGWDTRTGKLIARIHVGGQPHGLLVWPQPGRYSLGHTGNMR